MAGHGYRDTQVNDIYRFEIFMDYSFLDLLTLLGAVGLFLYGMKVMSEGLQKVAGERMRSILSAMTKNRFTGLFTGILITALIQSSSASTVMVVSFVNAGLMSLADSMAVIMGANVGTTATSWLITLFGFKVDITAFTLPLIGVSIPFLFASKSSYKSTAECLIGFAMLFMGLEFINDNVPDLQSNPEVFGFLVEYTSMGFLSIIIFLIVGCVLTMIIQSSSAAFAIILIMCSKGWIQFDIACAMVLGSNIGTTITPVIASLGGNTAARKAALGHVMFNCFGTVWALILFYPFVAMNVDITKAVGLGDPHGLISYLDNLQATDPAAHQLAVSGGGDAAMKAQMAHLQLAVSFGLSIFHTAFNIVNVLLMIWFTKYFVKIADYIIKPKHKEDDEFQLKYISTGMLTAGELNISQAQHEITVYAERVKRMFEMVKQLQHTTPDTEEFNSLYSRIGKYESISDRMEIEIANYLNRVVDSRLSYESKIRIAAMLTIVGEIESMADSCNRLAHTMSRQHEAKVTFNETVEHNVESMFRYVSEAIDNMLVVVKEMDADNVAEKSLSDCYNKEREINNFRNTIRSENIENINQKIYPYQEGIFYMDIIGECEKLGDYIINVIDGVKSQLPVPAK